MTSSPTDSVDDLQFTQCGKICKAVVITEADKVGRERQSILRQGYLEQMVESMPAVEGKGVCLTTQASESLTQEFRI